MYVNLQKIETWENFHVPFSICFIFNNKSAVENETKANFCSIFHCIYIVKNGTNGKWNKWKMKHVVLFSFQFPVDWHTYRLPNMVLFNFPFYFWWKMKQMENGTCCFVQFLISWRLRHILLNKICFFSIFHCTSMVENGTDGKWNMQFCSVFDFLKIEIHIA